MEEEIVYQLEVSDLFATYRYDCKTNKSMNLVKLFAYTFFMITIINTLMKIEEELWLKIFSGVVTLGISVLGFNLFIYFVSSLIFLIHLPRSKNNGIICIHTLRITPTQIIERTSVNQTQYQWNSVKRLHELPHHLLIILNSNQVYTIPKRAFENPTDYQRFYEVAHQFLRQSTETN